VPAAIDRAIKRVFNHRGLSRPLRAKSLIATLFGDVIESYGGRIWLGDLIDLVQLFDINERLLRTSIYRLGADGWVIKTREGRRSIYELSTEGREQTALAHELIYHHPQKNWNGVWNFVIVPAKGIPAARLFQLQHRLSLMGFGMLGKNIFAHPDMDNKLVIKVVAELGLQDQVPIMQSHTVGTATRNQGFELNREMVKQCCPYDEADIQYQLFIEAYQPVLETVKNATSISKENSFRIRILIIHDYRRLLFKDPQLPVELLPPDWSGNRVREIVRQLYNLVYEQANNHYLDVCADTSVRQRIKRDFFTRLGGLS